MPTLFNVADFKDPSDPQGRSYREVNNSKVHTYELGQMVELENGCRAIICIRTRDCDGTPLYSICMGENFPSCHGFCEDSLRPVTGNHQERKV